MFRKLNKPHLTKFKQQNYFVGEGITNEPTAINDKSDRPHLGQLKDLEISKYKRFFSLERP
jgi:hypothetical protein